MSGLIKFLVIITMLVVGLLSYVHQEQVFVDPECEAPGPLCTSSGVTYKLYWDPIWKK